MLANSGETTAPCGVPLVVAATTPSSITPAFSHLRIRRMTRRSPIGCSTKRTSQSWLTASKNPAISASKTQFTARVSIPTASASSASCWPRPGRNPWFDRLTMRAEPEEVLLVDRVQHLDQGALDDLVLHRRNAERALPPVRLPYVPPLRWLRPVAPAMNPGMQISKPPIQIVPVFFPCDPIRSRRCFPLAAQGTSRHAGVFDHAGS